MGLLVPLCSAIPISLIIYINDFILLFLPIDCPDQKMSPCVLPVGEREQFCVDEFKFCDGVEDCPGGSDESQDCADGLYYIHGGISMSLYLRQSVQTLEK